LIEHSSSNWVSEEYVLILNTKVKFVDGTIARSERTKVLDVEKLRLGNIEKSCNKQKMSDLCE
jgi:hypothetical protein